MANWARGLASGLQTGYVLGEALQRGAERKALAEEAARYTPTEGAYGPGLAQNIEQLRALQTQNPEQASQYEPAIAELQRRQALTAPDYSIASGPQNFATREEAVRAAAPLRAQGLANVYRQFGNIEQADAAETRAQQARAAGLQISRLEREETEAIETKNRQKQDADWWKTRLTDAEGQQRAPTTEDFLAASQRNAASLISAGKLTEAGGAFREFMTTARGQIELQTVERGEAIRKAVGAAVAGDLKPAQEFYRKFVPNGANVTDFSMDDKGVITIKQVDLNGAKLPDTKLTRDQLVQGLVAFNDPAKLIEYTQQSFMNNLGERRQAEIERHNRAVEKQGQQRLALTGDYYKSQLERERMGSTQYFIGQDGNTYASTPAMGPNGLTFQVTKVNPEGIKLVRPGTEGSGKKPTEVPEAGKRFVIDGKTLQSDGEGGYISLQGVLPEARATHLEKAGVPKNAIGQLPWSSDGTEVGFRGRAYKVNDAKDMKALTADYEKYGAADIGLEEYSKLPHGQKPPSRMSAGPAITYRPDPRAPGLFAGQEAWRGYRTLQANPLLDPTQAMLEELRRKGFAQGLSYTPPED